MSIPFDDILKETINEKLSWEGSNVIISCCNTIYEYLTKLLAEKVKKVFPKVTDETQSAFV